MRNKWNKMRKIGKNIGKIPEKEINAQKGNKCPNKGMDS